jgi:hypothetical protein
MSEQEKEIRAQIAREIQNDLKMSMENCACLGRDAYGEYIDKLVRSITLKIKKEQPDSSRNPCSPMDGSGLELYPQRRLRTPQ